MIERLFSTSVQGRRAQAGLRKRASRGAVELINLTVHSQVDRSLHTPAIGVESSLRPPKCFVIVVLL